MDLFYKVPFLGPTVPTRTNPDHNRVIWHPGGEPLTPALRQAASLWRVSSGRKELLPPRSFLADSGTWPQGPFRDDAPPAVYLAAHIAEGLLAELENSSKKGLAKAAGVTPTTITNLAEGETWTHISKLAALEVAIGRVLWKGVHIKAAKEQNRRKR